MVQSTGPKNQQESLHRGGGGEINGGSQSLWQQMGLHFPPFSGSNRQLGEESLACSDGEEKQGEIEIEIEILHENEMG